MRRLDRLRAWLREALLPSPPRTVDSTRPTEQQRKLLGHHATPRKYFLSPSKSLISAVILLFLALGFGILMWCTHFYDTSILKLVSIRNDLDLIYDLWRMPPTRPTLSVYIFNYTNTEKAISGYLPTVQEIGPYVFRERMERINVKFHDNGTVSFQENKTIVFDPELSNGSLNDIIRVPNVPLLVLFDLLRNMDFVGQMTFSRVILSIFNVELFQKVTVNDFIWGYEDELYNTARKIKGFISGNEEPKFGFLAKRRGVHHTVVTMKTGDPDLDEVGTITAFDGLDKFNVWEKSSCDRIEGSDGTLFPGNRVNKKMPFYLANHDLCRNLPLIFNETTKTVDGFPVHKYIVPENAFDYTEEHKENSCYKYKDVYPPGGSFYTGPCNNGVPMYITFPHFWMGDNELQNSVHGLNPDPAKHQSSFLLHDRLGVTLKALTRFQLNVRFHKAKFINQFSEIKEGTLLPIAWTEYDSGLLPEDFKQVVHHLTYTVRTVQQILKIISLILCLFAILFLYIQIKRTYLPRHFHPSYTL